MSISVAVAEAFAPVIDAIEAGRLPGAVLGAIDAEGQRAVVMAGSAEIVPTTSAVTRETYFDLASLTKSLFTTELLIENIARGTVDLDQPLGELIPDLRLYERDAPERHLTVRSCLVHQTFLPAVEPLYTLGLEPHTLEAYVLQRTWPHGKPVYSDINFILLGILAERLNDRPLREHALAPGFSFAPPTELCAATEWCPWRRRVLRGEVHDENAAAFGGIAGHAGLFGTIDGVLDYAGALLADLRDPHSLRGSLLIREPSDRTLGWEMATPGWHGGRYASDRTLGHTGFTGTSMWIDPDAGVAWSLLTNRVHPTRHAPSVVLTLRPAVSDLLLARLTRR